MMKGFLVVLALLAAGCAQGTNATTAETPEDRYVAGVWDAYGRQSELGISLQVDPIEVLDVFDGDLGMIGEGRRFCEIKAEANGDYIAALVQYNLDWGLRTGLMHG